VNLDDFVQKILTLSDSRALRPLKQLILGLSTEERAVLCIFFAVAGLFGFLLGRRRAVGVRAYNTIGALRFPKFQNRGETLVSRVLLANFGPPDYHLMNHITIRMEDGTTQVDHILVSRFGVFVIETKDYSGWIFANGAAATWTRVFFRRKFKFQNPILQNYRHVRAVHGLLDFLPKAAIKTEMPNGVVSVEHLSEYVRRQTEEIIPMNRMQFCVGRLETARLAISGETDVAHVQSLERRFGGGAA
jgi:Nuclease-related domain